MMCFRDMTFCVATCSNTTCPRMLTERVQQDASVWWEGEGAPIAVSDFSETCEDFKEIL